MFSPDSAIDGAVLEVILRKAEAIREATGVTVPLPDERGPVTDALMSAVLLRRGGAKQLTFDLRLDDGVKAMATRWKDAEENEKKSRARFAQNVMKPGEVIPEWAKANALLGDPKAAAAFVDAALKRFDAPMEHRKSGYVAHLNHLPLGLRERLDERNLSGTIRLATAEPAPAGTELLTRTHPLTSTLAEALVEGALDPAALPDLGMGRVGAWLSPAVQRKTLIALLRLRFKLTIHSHKNRLLLAEEAALVAIAGGEIVASGDAVRAMLAEPAAADLALPARARFIAQAHENLASLIEGPLALHARARAEDLLADHGRLRAVAGSSRVSVEPALPPDVIGLFTLLPVQG